MFMYYPDNYALSAKVIRAIGGISSGQAEFDEIYKVLQKIDPKNLETWTNAWNDMGDRLRNMAIEAEAKGHYVTAGGEYSRAVGYYHNAQFYLDSYDPRRLEIYMKYRECFKKGTQWEDSVPVEVHIPYEDTFLYAYYLKTTRPAAGMKSPTLVWFGGLDSTAEEAYFAVCKDFCKRGFNCLIVDGPGQGASLRLNKIPTRYDYEAAGTAAFDYLETLDDVDLTKVAVMAWSLGGYYAPRIASFEHRYSALITYGARYDAGKSWRERYAAGGQKMALSSYAMLVHGVKTMEEAVEKFQKFNLEGVLQGVTCDALVVFGEDDPQQKLEEAQRLCKEMVNAKSVTFKFFTKDEGACGHVCQDNLTLGNSYSSDWLMDKFGMTPKV